MNTSINTAFRFRRSSLSAALALATLTLSADTLADDKAVQIRPGGETLQVQLQPLQEHFQVGEALRFDIRGNRDFFLYLYSVDEDTGESVLLLPSRKHTGNKYPAGKTIRVPNPTIEFYADKPGIEQLVMIASTRYIEVDTARMKPVGDFSRGPTKSLEDQFEAKAIAIRAPAGTQRSGVVVTRLDVTIAGETALPPASDEAATVVLLSTDRDSYAEGEQVNIAYGADREGWVHLYLVDPKGQREMLLKKPVDGQSLARVQARATAPIGEQMLVAAWSADEDLDTSQIDTPALEDSQGKGLALIGERQVPVATRRFTITTAQ